MRVVINSTVDTITNYPDEALSGAEIEERNSPQECFELCLGDTNCNIAIWHISNTPPDGLCYLTATTRVEDLVPDGDVPPSLFYIAERETRTQPCMYADHITDLFFKFIHVGNV